MRKTAFTLAARRDLAELPPEVRTMMIGLIEAFARGLSVDAAPLRGRDVVRLKGGDYRALVEVTRSTVTVFRVRHRNIVYRP